MPPTTLPIPSLRTKIGILGDCGNSSSLEVPPHPQHPKILASERNLGRSNILGGVAPSSPQQCLQ
eukprot:11942740-Alexandrium_andersonii.AAC.1